MSSKAKTMNAKKNARPSKEVKIMLKLNWSGRRIALSHPVDASSITLEAVLKLVAEQEKDTPIPTILSSSAYEDSSLIYVRTSTPKSQWHSTTLNQLGIENGGSALLTLNVGCTNNGNSTANLATTVSNTIREALPSKPAPSKSSHSAAPLKKTDVEHKVPKDNGVIGKESMKPTHRAAGMVVDSTERTSIQLTPRAAVEKILSKNFDVDSKACCMALLKIVNNIVSKPDEAKYRKINIRNNAFDQKVASKQGGLDFLHVIGFNLQYDSGTEYLVLDPQNESQKTMLEAQDVLLEAAVDLGFSPTELPRVSPPSRPMKATTLNPANFDVYRGQMFNVAAAAAGADPTTIAPDGNVYVSKIDRELNSLIAKTKQLEEEMASKELDRGIVALLPANAVNDDSVVIVEEGASGKGDGALLSSRAKRILEESQKRESGGFTTKAMRDLDKIKQTKIYAFTKLRIYFPDGHSISAKFYPTETVAAVKEVLVNEVLTTDSAFDFYVTPPRRALMGNKTLTEEQLVPAAKIHVSWKDPPPSSNYIKAELFVRQNDKEEFPESKGVIDVAKQGSELKSVKKEDEMVNRMLGKSGIGAPLKSSSSQDDQNAGKKGAEKYPKWFKR